MIVSLLLNLIIPKCIDEYQYAYWQMYMLYVSYVGILHFGMLDGIVLRYSQFDYEELDKPRIRSQFVVLLISDSIISLMTVAFATFALGGITKTIVVFVAIGIITRNIFTYTSYSFQITNRINKYATLIVAQRLFYGLGILFAVFFGARDFIWLCLIDLCADMFGIFLGSIYNKGMYFGKLIKFSETLKETKTNLSTGILLLIANWASQFLTGSAKMIVQWRWDTIIFGKTSFAFSVSNLFLNFITAISVVLFPSLKRMNQSNLPLVYDKLRKAISPVLFITLSFYFPGCFMLQLWLPKYTESLIYLGMMLPIIVFSSKVSLLTNNYLKAYREEKKLLYINVASVIGGIVLYLFCGFILNDISALLITLVMVIMLRSIVSEVVVMRIIHVNFQKEFFIEGVVTVSFIVITMTCDLLFGFVMYFVVLCIYLFMHKNDCLSTIRIVKEKVKKA